MNYNKVNVITNEKSNAKGFIDLGSIFINENTTVLQLLTHVSELQESVTELENTLATYKAHTKAAFTALQEKFDTISSSIQSNKAVTTAELNNIKEAIKLLGGVL